MSVGSELRCRSGGAEFVVLVFLGSSCYVSSGIALIESHSPVSRSSSSSNYILFSLPSVSRSSPPRSFPPVLARLCY